MQVVAWSSAPALPNPEYELPHASVNAGPLQIFKSLYEIYGYNKKQYAPDMEPVFKQAEVYGRPPLTTTESPIPPDSASSSAG